MNLHGERGDASGCGDSVKCGYDAGYGDAGVHRRSAKRMGLYLDVEIAEDAREQRLAKGNNTR